MKDCPICKGTGFYKGEICRCIANKNQNQNQSNQPLNSILDVLNVKKGSEWDFLDNLMNGKL